ncbi:MAG TPA: type II toxin-antitoxin system prevent-host-death family antitoxin [Actinobacteria bacterium]|nr:type II toxin-antitoxin system prevent-host-death family antitoxin [Actinomycetota bacterium]
MAIKILPASEVRGQLSSILKRLAEDKAPVYITQYGRAKAVLMDIERYDALMQLLEDLEDIREFRIAEGEAAQDFEELMTEIEGRPGVSA